MNKTIRRIFAGSLLAALLLAGCGREKETPTVRIGVALYQQEDTFISTVVQQLEQLARAEEQRRGIKINLNLADARSSQSAQNEQVDRFLQQGYDMLCVNLVDRTAAAVIVDKAQAADVPVVFFNREPVEEDLARWDRAYYVGSPAATAGTLQGKIVLDAWREDPASIDRNGDGVIQYVMLEGEPGHQDALMRTEYSVKALMTAAVPVEKLANDNANWERGQASLRMEQWLREGEVDLGFVTLPAPEGMRTIPLTQDPLVAIMPKNHRLAQLDEIPIQELGEDPFISLLQSSAHDIHRALDNAGVRPNIKFTTKDDYAILAMVEQGLGISIVPQLLIQGRTQNLAVRPLKPRASRTIALAIPEGKPLPVVEAFAQTAVAWVNEQSGK